jgi:hypothetical protein
VLAGYEPAGAEEIPSEAPPESRSPADSATATRAQLEEIAKLIGTLDRADPAIDWRSRALEYAGVPARALTKTGAEMLIEKLQAELAGL